MRNFEPKKNPQDAEGIRMKIKNILAGVTTCSLLVASGVVFAWDYNSPLNDSDQETIAVKNGSTDRIIATLDSDLGYDVPWYGWPSYDKVRGTQSCYWMGDKPYNPNSTVMTSEFYFAGVGASVSAGSGGVGAGFSVDGNTATRVHEVPNEWNTIYNHSSVRVSGYTFYRSETVVCNFVFGIENFDTSAYDYDYL